MLLNMAALNRSPDELIDIFEYIYGGTKQYDSYKKWSISWLAFVTCLIPLLIYRMILKKRQIKNPINNNSYCVISVHIVNLSIASLII